MTAIGGPVFRMFNLRMVFFSSTSVSLLVAVERVFVVGMAISGVSGVKCLFVWSVLDAGIRRFFFSKL